jgi:hypothetical protein
LIRDFLSQAQAPKSPMFFAGRGASLAPDQRIQKNQEFSADTVTIDFDRAIGRAHGIYRFAVLGKYVLLMG